MLDAVGQVQPLLQKCRKPPFCSQGIRQFLLVHITPRMVSHGHEGSGCHAGVLVVSQKVTGWQMHPCMGAWHACQTGPNQASFQGATFSIQLQIECCLHPQVRSVFLHHKVLGLKSGFLKFPAHSDHVLTSKPASKGAKCGPCARKAPWDAGNTPCCAPSCSYMSNMNFWTLTCLDSTCHASALG